MLRVIWPWKQNLLRRGSLRQYLCVSSNLLSTERNTILRTLYRCTYNWNFRSSLGSYHLLPGLNYSFYVLIFFVDSLHSFASCIKCDRYVCLCRWKSFHLLRASILSNFFYLDHCALCVTVGFIFKLMTSSCPGCWLLFSLMVLACLFFFSLWKYFIMIYINAWQVLKGTLKKLMMIDKILG